MISIILWIFIVAYTLGLIVMIFLLGEVFQESINREGHLPSVPSRLLLVVGSLLWPLVILGVMGVLAWEIGRDIISGRWEEEKNQGDNYE